MIAEPETRLCRTRQIPIRKSVASRARDRLRRRDRGSAVLPQVLQRLGGWEGTEGVFTVADELGRIGYLTAVLVASWDGGVERNVQAAIFIDDRSIVNVLVSTLYLRRRRGWGPQLPGPSRRWWPA